jgi:ubiquinone/menaquinone biosynthesis C-methylase UbiE
MQHQRRSIMTSSQTPATSAAPSLVEIKARQQAMWASGDYAVVGTTLQIVGESLAEASDLNAGQRVLDVACGNGNACLAAARRFAKVTGVDYVPALLARAEARARADGVEVTLVEGDAEALPFPEGSFDVALSTFGVMFAPDHAQAARELARVTVAGGKIGLASWTPEGFIGQLFRCVGKYAPPAPGLPSPLQWGTEAHLTQLFAGRAKIVAAERKHFTFRYLSTAHFVDVFRRFYGPTYKAFGALDAQGQAALTSEMTALIDQHNRAGDAALAVPSEYLEVVLRREG